MVGVQFMFEDYLDGNPILAHVFLLLKRSLLGFHISSPSASFIVGILSTKRGSRSYQGVRLTEHDLGVNAETHGVHWDTSWG